MATDNAREELIQQIPDADRKEFDLIKNKLAFLETIEDK